MLSYLQYAKDNPFVLAKNRQPPEKQKKKGRSNKDDEEESVSVSGRNNKEDEEGEEPKVHPMTLRSSTYEHKTMWATSERSSVLDISMLLIRETMCRIEFASRAGRVQEEEGIDLDKVHDGLFPSQERASSPL